MIDKIRIKVLKSNIITIWLIIVLFKLKFKFSALFHGIRSNLFRQDSYYNFRRNIHRLEKGLSYSEIRSTFAKDYIIESVNYLLNGVAKGTFDTETIAWGISVLETYFKQVDKSEEIKEAKIEFEKIIHENKLKPDSSQIPSISKYRQKVSITYDDLLSLSIRRRSVRYFTNQKVDEELIKKAYEVAKFSPSACNRQAFDFYFYNETEIVQKISEVPGGVKGYSLPSVIVVIGNYSGYFDERDVNAPIIDSSLSTMSFMYALETLGLSSVCINWPNLPDRERKIRKIISLKPYQFIVMMIGVGYPAEEGKIPYSAKRSADSVVKSNKYIKI